MTEFLTKAAILAADDIVTEQVHVPQWGGTVLVRGMTGDERNAYEKQLLYERPAGNRSARRAGQTTTEVRREEIRNRLIMWCCVDQDGNRIFSEDDLSKINTKSAAAIERVIEVAMRLSGLDDDDIEDMAERMAKDPFVSESTP